MKKHAKILITFVAVAAVAIIVVVANATSNSATPMPPYMDEPYVEIDFDTADQNFLPPSFMHFKGNVTEITPFYDFVDGESLLVEDMSFILLECEETNEMTMFLVDLNTAMLVDTELTQGMVLVGWFDSSLPVPMIWPPQHRAVAIVAPLNHHAILDRFDENFASTDGVNTLEITDVTEIVFQDGTPFEGELRELIGRKLLVEFYEEGRIIAPAKITILFEVAVHPIHILSDEELAEIELFPTDPPDTPISGGPALLSPEDINLLWANMFDPATVQIVVKGEVIEAAAPFTDSTAGAVMLPVVAVAEALGYTVIDNGDEVIIAPGSILTAGENTYFRGREMPRALTTAPVIVDGVMFVPWEFFHEILSGAAYVEDGNVHVVPQGE